MMTTMRVQKKARNTSRQGRTDSEKVVRQQQEVWNYWTGAGSSNDHLRYAADHGNSFNAKAKSEEGSKEAGKEDITRSMDAICEGATAHGHEESPSTHAHMMGQPGQKSREIVFQESRPKHAQSNMEADEDAREEEEILRRQRC